MAQNIEIRYQPDEYPELLKSYMQDAYDALAEENHHRYELAVTKITMELKYLTKSHLLSDAQAQDMKAYFWSEVE